jgi:hypothetical protein
MTVVTFNQSCHIGLSPNGSRNVRQPLCQIAAISTKYGEKRGCGIRFASLHIAMSLGKGMVTPHRVVAFMVAAIVTYVLWRGPERFYYESLGTWVISPSIYVRVLPVPLNEWLLGGMRSFPLLSGVLCVAPLVMLSLSFAFALSSMWKESLVHAFLSLGLAATVFSVYHFVQPLGITLIRY